MSYSMSPQQPNGQRPPYPPYSPYSNAASAANNSSFGPPPAKRQRTSPDPRSPQPGTAPYPPHQQHSLPNVNTYGNPYGHQQVQSPYGTPGGYAASPQSSFNTPQPYPHQQMPWQSHSQPVTPATTPGNYNTMRQNSPPQALSREMMPPPPRPNDREEKAGHEELGDSLYGSGINIKDEENYLHSTYYNRHGQDSSFSTNQNTSFGSETISTGNSFNILTQGTTVGSQGRNEALAGTMGDVKTEEQIVQEQRLKREKAARELAESRQHHLNNQFLLCNNVRKRMDRLALEQGVTLNMHGVYVRQPDTQAMVNGDGSQGIVATADKVTGVQRDSRPESVVNQGSPFEHVVALISLAAGERLRGLLDEAYALARARRYGDHGRVVPTDFADIAEGPGKRTEETVTPQNITGSQWEKPPTPESPQAGPVSQSTISFQGTLNAHLRTLATADRAAEAARQKKRLARKRAAEAAANGADNMDTSLDDAPATNGAPAEAAAPLKLTKKEIQRQAKEKTSASEAQLHSTTNQTAAMMALGKKGQRYSWMTGGASSMPTNRFAKPQSTSNTAAAGTVAATGASGTATPAKTEGPGTPGAGGTAMASGPSAERVKGVEWGEWREEATPPGVEMRDWVMVLERDGKEKKALELAVLRMK